MQRLILSATLAVTLACGANVAIGQEKVDGKTTEELKKQDTVPPATGRNLPEQAGAQEPSSKLAHPNSNPNVFVNGVLTVPGARTDVDTAPAKFSSRTNADDKLPIAGYRLKQLSPDQLRDIARQLDTGGQAAGDSSAYTVVGAEVPSTVAERALKPMPASLTAKFPGLQGTGFMRAGNKFVVVDLDNSLVIGAIEG